MICDAFDPCSIPPFTDLSLLSFHIPYHIGKAFKKKKIKEIIEYWKMTLLLGMVRVSCRGGIKFKYKFKFYLSHTRLYRDCITSSEMCVR